MNIYRIQYIEKHEYMKENEITVFLVDVDNRMIDAWKKMFCDEKNVSVINMDVVDFLNENQRIDCVATAGNSFGLMTGGLDAAYIKYFGEELQENVQKRIAEEYYGEQPVGTSITVKIPKHPQILLIYSPSMRIPQPIIDPRVVYSCTRTALIEAIKSGAKNVVLPAFGHLTGRINGMLLVI